ncbi:hypothetical protein [Oceanospirillum sanctuarii]|uniref:hypothetical protein n=1 Tax=Oceanospirillum sanctuarii TaxID=1434821 RepID=UPI001593ADE4|nr:hypothetical protein [Oceanospirillum sanctuarii]
MGKSWLSESAYSTQEIAPREPPPYNTSQIFRKQLFAPLSEQNYPDKLRLRAASDAGFNKHPHFVPDSIDKGTRHGSS